MEKDVIEGVILDSLRTCDEKDMPTDGYITHLLGKFKIRSMKWKSVKRNNG